MSRVVCVICDGLRSDMVRPEITPNLCRIGGQARVFTHHGSVFPSTTRTTAASIATGCHPGRHGLEGNCVALDEGEGLAPVSVGPVGFRERLRNATGETLRVPTMSERLKDTGGAIVFSNVSPGAAYFHDPDGHGYVYHRSGSFGPNLLPITGQDHLDVSHDAAGDTVMTERFVSEVLQERKPAYAMLWQCEPDHTQHASPMGSPDHLAAIRAADENAGKVEREVKSQIEAGEDIMLIIASDHGHETVSGTLPLTDRLVDAGLKAGRESSDVVVASNGLSAHLYFSDEHRSRIPDVIGFLNDMDEIEAVHSGQDLQRLGHRPDSPLAISVTTRRDDLENEFGVPGRGIAVDDPLHYDTNMGCGQHGGLGPHEQSPFLMILGGGYEAGSRCDLETSAVDLAPTMLHHLGLPSSGMDGQVLPQK